MIYFISELATILPVRACVRQKRAYISSQVSCRSCTIFQAGRGLLVQLNRLNRYQSAGFAQDVDCYLLCLRLHGKKHLG